MKFTFAKAAGTLAVALGLAAGTAAAQQSQLNIVGSTRIFQLAPGPLNNLIIDFRTPDAPPVSNGTVVTCCFPGDQTGVFAILPAIGQPGVNIDFVFGPAATPPATTLPTTILTIGGFTFTGAAFGLGNTGTPVFLTYDPFTNSTTATLNTTGTVTGPGLPAAGTMFVGSYTTQFPGLTPAQLQAQIEAGTTFPKTISATFITGVPEPATVALMGTGLVALFGIGLRRRQNG